MLSVFTTNEKWINWQRSKVIGGKTGGKYAKRPMGTSVKAWNSCAVVGRIFFRTYKNYLDVYSRGQTVGLSGQWDFTSHLYKLPKTILSLIFCESYIRPHFWHQICDPNMYFFLIYFFHFP